MRKCLVCGPNRGTGTGFAKRTIEQMELSGSTFVRQAACGRIPHEPQGRRRPPQAGKDGSAASLLAVRRVQLKIDRELRHAGRELPVRALTGSGVIPLISLDGYQ